MSVPHELLEAAFGPGAGDTPEERAKVSARQFVRSMDQLAEASPNATGRRLTALEALDAYGWDVLSEVALEGAALLSEGPKAAGELMRRRRELLGLSATAIATAARVTPTVVERLEAYARVPIRQIERLARVLGLDERYVSFRAEAPRGNEDLAVRLRTVGVQNPRMSPSSVCELAEAAWVASTQLRLQRALGLQPGPIPVHKSANYGQPGYPSFMHGYWLARDTRERLQLGHGPLETSVRELTEDRLGIPLIQSELGSTIAGATVEAGADRAIVVSLQGRNRNVFFRRCTVAHELGHLLYDPERELNQLRVDAYDELDRPAHELRDRVEQRANAFAVEFIAPQAAVLDVYQTAADDPLGRVIDTFGLSFTAARYQIWNALERRVPLESLTTDLGRRANQRWEAMEAYTVDYHPLPRIRPSRAGRFSAVVFRAADQGVISWDTAVEMLEATSVDELRTAGPALRDLFPSVFEGW